MTIVRRTTLLFRARNLQDSQLAMVKFRGLTDGELKTSTPKLVWILKFRQWFCRPSFETALAPEEIPWRIGGNSSPLFPLVVFILPSDDQGGLNERGEGRALTPLCPMVKDYPQSFFGMKPSKTPHIRFFINNFLVPNQPPKD